MKRGIVLAGGTGSRLHPLTLGVSKQLLPVYDKPMIYYPLSVLMLAGIRQILIITAPDDADAFAKVLGDGSQWGIEMLSSLVQSAAAKEAGATIFATHVEDPERYGVVELDADGRPLAITEKPSRPRSNWAVAGLYFFDGEVVDVASRVRPSARGELEITDVIQHYLDRGTLEVLRLSQGHAWLDTGTFDSLVEAGEFVRVLQKRQGTRTACLEEIAWRMGYIGRRELTDAAGRFANNEYGRYLQRLADEADRS